MYALLSFARIIVCALLTAFIPAIGTAASWEPIIPLSDNATDDLLPEWDVDMEYGDGVIGAVWQSPGTETDYTYYAPRFKRSTDQGVTWSDSVELHTYIDAETSTVVGTGSTGLSQIAYAGNQVWVLATARSSVGSPFVLFRRSIDGGATWSPVGYRTFGSCTIWGMAIASDGTGNLVCAAALSNGFCNGSYVFVLTSADYGEMWEMSGVLPNAGSDHVTQPSVANSGNHWAIAAATLLDTEGLTVHRSITGELTTWTKTVIPQTADNFRPAQEPDIAFGRDGSGIVSWVRREPNPSTTATLFCSRTSDYGATWSDPFLLSTTISESQSQVTGPSVTYKGCDSWMIAWTEPGIQTAEDADVLYVESHDDGFTWSPRQPLASNVWADGIARDGDVALTAHPNGRVFAAWTHGSTSADPYSDPPEDQNYGDILISRTTEANCSPNIVVNPIALSFGSVEIGQSSDALLTIENNGEDILQVSSVSTPEPAVSMVGEPAVPFEVPPGTSTTLIIRFSPQTAGPTEGMLTISSSDADEPQTSVPFWGFGTSPEVIAPHIQLSTDSLDFGTRTIGTVTPMTLAISNPGNAALQVSDLSGLAGTQFSHNTAVPFVVPAGGAQDISLEFRPTAEGATSATLAVASDDPDSPLLNVLLIGTGRCAVDEFASGATRFDLGVEIFRVKRNRRYVSVSAKVAQLSPPLPSQITEGVPPTTLWASVVGGDYAVCDLAPQPVVVKRVRGTRDSRPGRPAQSRRIMLRVPVNQIPAGSRVLLTVDPENRFIEASERNNFTLTQPF